eukprot:5158241-Alexandrium_andersonii.AAC.1
MGLSGASDVPTRSADSDWWYCPGVRSSQPPRPRLAHGEVAGNGVYDPRRWAVVGAQLVGEPSVET